MELTLRVEGKSQQVPAGSHICQLYSKAAELLPVTSHLLHAALRSHHKCLFAGEPTSVANLKEALVALKVDVAAALASGQLVLASDREQFLPTQRMDPYFLISSHQTLIARALRDGWQGVCLSIDMGWMARGIATVEQILKYESMADAVFTFQDSPIIALIHYDYDTLPGNLIVEMLKLHPLAVVGKFLRRNPFYVDAEKYLLKILRLREEREIQGNDTALTRVVGLRSTGRRG